MSMHSQQQFTWAEFEPYLDQLLDLEPGARETWLAELSVKLPEIAKSLRELIREHAQLDAEGFLREFPRTWIDDLSPDLRRMIEVPATKETNEFYSPAEIRKALRDRQQQKDPPPSPPSLWKRIRRFLSSLLPGR